MANDVNEKITKLVETGCSQYEESYSADLTQIIKCDLSNISLENMRTSLDTFKRFHKSIKDLILTLNAEKTTQNFLSQTETIFSSLHGSILDDICQHLSYLKFLATVDSLIEKSSRLKEWIKCFQDLYDRLDSQFSSAVTSLVSMCEKQLDESGSIYELLIAHWNGHLSSPYSIDSCRLFLTFVNRTKQLANFDSPMDALEYFQLEILHYFNIAIDDTPISCPVLLGQLVESLTIQNKCREFFRSIKSKVK